jgi:hypothetical protein
MQQIKTLRDFSSEPKCYKEYLLALFSILLFAVCTGAIYLFDRHWLALVFGCLSLSAMVVQISASSGSIKFNTYKAFEGWLKLQSNETHSLIIEDKQLDAETKRFVVLWLRQQRK